MGAEGNPQNREADPWAVFNDVARSFGENIRDLSELAQAKKAQGGALPPEEEAKLNALQEKIVNAHAQPL